MRLDVRVGRGRCQSSFNDSREGLGPFLRGCAPSHRRLGSRPLRHLHRRREKSLPSSALPAMVLAPSGTTSRQHRSPRGPLLCGAGEAGRGTRCRSSRSTWHAPRLSTPVVARRSRQTPPHVLRRRPRKLAHRRFFRASVGRRTRSSGAPASRSPASTGLPGSSLCALPMIVLPTSVFLCMFLSAE